MFLQASEAILVVNKTFELKKCFGLVIEQKQNMTVNKCIYIGFFKFFPPEITYLLFN